MFVLVLILWRRRSGGDGIEGVSRHNKDWLWIHVTSTNACKTIGRDGRVGNAMQGIIDRGDGRRCYAEQMGMCVMTRMTMDVGMRYLVSYEKQCTEWKCSVLDDDSSTSKCTVPKYRDHRNAAQEVPCREPSRPVVRGVARDAEDGYSRRVTDDGGEQQGGFRRG